MRRSLGLAAGVAAMAWSVWTASPSTAHACSPPVGGFCLEQIDVFPELTVRPTNACIVAGWSTSPGPGGGWTFDASPGDAGAPERDAGPRSFRYVAADGTEVALLGVPMLCPEHELAPNTEYTIVGPTACGDGPPREYARFTTSEGPDTTPPSPPGAITVQCLSDSCDDSACCGPYTASIVHSVWEPARDDSGVVIYPASGLTRRADVEGFYETSGRVMFDTLFFSGRRVARGGFVGHVVAWDIAGNASEPGPASPGCPPPDDAAIDTSEPDAAIDAAGLDAASELDAGTPSLDRDAAGGDPGTGAASCTVRSSIGGSRATGWSTVFLLVLALRARRGRAVGFTDRSRARAPRAL